MPLARVVERDAAVLVLLEEEVSELAGPSQVEREGHLMSGSGDRDVGRDQLTRDPDFATHVVLVDGADGLMDHLEVEPPVKKQLGNPLVVLGNLPRDIQANEPPLVVGVREVETSIRLLLEQESFADVESERRRRKLREHAHVLPVLILPEDDGTAESTEVTLLVSLYDDELELLLALEQTSEVVHVFGDQTLLHLAHDFLSYHLEN
ncbi:hypothetical protein C0581_01605 [Candidatus Parcubacteria bacterium]|nr:MAG: hypothetical protein C0581_01605 [Candidatus Parcubacteria bacterium]